MASPPPIEHFSKSLPEPAEAGQDSQRRDGPGSRNGSGNRDPIPKRPAEDARVSGHPPERTRNSECRIDFVRSLPTDSRPLGSPVTILIILRDMRIRRRRV
jgi:hypothetical protein